MTQNEGKCEECEENPVESNLELCEGCCDHSDKDGFTCLICGKDCLEDMMSEAYELAKDRDKYGE